MSDKVIKGGNGDPKDASERLEQAPVEHKPFLTPQELVASLKARGVKFELCSEEDAVAYLREHNNYLRCASYRVLFDRKPAADDGTPGPYVNLDFEHLRDLSSLDRQLREAFLDVCIDVEHFAKLYVLNRAQAEGEDGYAIVADYLNQLDYQRRRYVSRSLAVRSRGGRTHDEYKGDLIAHHLEDLSLWVFLEVVDFGTFVDLYKFCAKRWDDDVMAQEHYVLKSVKSLRNATAHNSCIINGFTKKAPRAESPTNSLLLKSMNELGIRNAKTRRTKMSNRRIAQMASSLWALQHFCTSKDALLRDAARLNALKNRFETSRQLYFKTNGIAPYFDFLWKLVDTWLPRQA
jgi:abortive infection bacteriophage resistance protein